MELNNNTSGHTNVYSHNINEGFEIGDEKINGYSYKGAADDDTKSNNSVESVKNTQNELGVNGNIQNANANRPVWSNSLEFLMSCIATSVGLGNIWRFPFIAYENGGGAFLIPYIIVLFLIGKPMYYLEMIVGQFSSRSNVKIWDLCPAFRGIGLGQLIGTGSVISYYSSLIALTAYYFVDSFRADLPWAKCLQSWGTNCVDSMPKMLRNESSNEQQVSSSEIHFLRIVLKQKDDISDGIGYPDLKLAGFLLLTWVVVFAIIVRSVKSSGKASYFLALFPYVVMLIILVRAVTLEGAVNGIIFFITPKWSELLNAKVWYAATTQLFFSLSVGMGTIVMFSSYNQFNHNIYRDAMIVTTLDTFTSLLGGITIFAILGNLAHNLNINDIDTVVKSGTGLAFISYPDAIAKFDVVPQLFAVLFFFMLFVLGIGSVCALQSSIVTVIYDQLQKFQFWLLALLSCIVGYLCALIYITPGGQWMLNLVDHFGGTLLIFTLGIFELVGIFWIYGLENFCEDLEFMTGRRVSIYWRICWAVITPGLLIIIFIYAMANLEPLQYSNWYYPDSATAAGWCLYAIGLFQFPLWMAWSASHKKSSAWYLSLKAAFVPNKHWGPKNQATKLEWIDFKQEIRDRKKINAINNNHSFWQRKILFLFGRNT